MFTSIKTIEVNSENNAKNVLEQFEEVADVNSLFYKYSLFDIKLELPSFNENINLSTKQLDFNANCLLFNYSKFCKHANMVAYELSADGSCFFHSLSLALYGNENYTFRLRLFTLN